LTIADKLMVSFHVYSTPQSSHFEDFLHTRVHCRLSPKTTRPTSHPWSAFYNSLKISHPYFIHTATSDAKTPSTFNVSTYIHCPENRLKYTQLSHHLKMGLHSWKLHCIAKQCWTLYPARTR